MQHKNLFSPIEFSLFSDVGLLHDLRKLATANRGVSRAIPFLSFDRPVRKKRERERMGKALNGFEAERNSRSFRFVLDRLTAITFLIVTGVLSCARRTLRGLFATPCQSSAKIVRDREGCRRDIRTRQCSSPAWSFGKISSPRRIGFSVLHTSNKRIWVTLCLLHVFIRLCARFL